MPLKLHYNFAEDVSLAARIGPTLGLTRLLGASVTDYNNVIKQVASGEERYTGGRRVENLCLQSQALGTAPWSTNGTGNITDDAGTDPNGGSTADRLNATGSGGLVGQDFTLSRPGTYTFTIYAKNGVGSGIAVQVADFDGGNQVAYIDLDAVSVLSEDAGFTTTLESVGSGWYKISVVWETAADLIGSINLYNSNGDANVGTTGDTLFLWGAQLEHVSGQDDPAPSEYQATTTAAVSKWYATKRRTNMAYDTAGLDSAPWAKSSCTVGTGVSDPLGGTNAFTITATAGNGALRLTGFAGAPVPFGDAKTCIFSAWMKRRTGTGDIRLYRGQTSATTTPTITSEWVRYSGVAAVPSGSGDIIGFLVVTDTDAIDVFQPQWEVGSAATAFIANTNTAAVESSAFDTAITPTGLLVEEERTNTILQSSDVASWAVGGDTLAIVGNEAIAPDGTLTADLIVDNNGGGAGNDVYVVQGHSFTVDTVFTVTTHLKANGLDWAQVNVVGLGALNSSAYFNLSTGEVGATVGANVTTTYIDDVGNGWYRCGITFTSDAADTTGSLRVYVAEGDADITVALDTTSSIFIWGSQVEVGAFPTAYIPTVAASVTRNKDDIQTSSIGTLWNDNAGSVYISQSRTAIASATFIDITDGGAGNDRLLSATAGSPPDELKITSASTGGAAGDISLTTTGDAIDTGNTVYRAAYAYADSDSELYVEGTRVGTGDQTVDVPTGIDTLHVGQNYLESVTLNGHIAEIRYYNTRHSNEDLENMSNGIFPTFGRRLLARDLLFDLNRPILRSLHD